MPVMQLLLYPMCDFTAHTRSMDLFADGYFLRRWDMDFCHDQYIGGSGIDPTDPRVSPLLAEDLSGLPPALLVTAGFDPLLDQDRQFAAALSSAGVAVDLREYGSLIHAFPNFFGLGGGAAAADLRDHFRPARASAPELTNRQNLAGTLDAWPRNPRRTLATISTPLTAGATC